MFFKCKHPADCLHVAKDATEQDSSEYPGQYTYITYHLYCVKCNERIDIEYAKPNHEIIRKSVLRELANERTENTQDQEQS